MYNDNLDNLLSRFDKRIKEKPAVEKAPDKQRFAARLYFTVLADNREDAEDVIRSMTMHMSMFDDISGVTGKVE